MSFAHLAPVGTLEYNGYSFDGASNIKVAVNFVYDEAGRTVVYHEHTITVHFFVHANSLDTDAQMLAIRATLSKAGKYLRFVDKGFGDDLVVNHPSGGGLRDVKWGPKPRIITWEPVGANQTCECVWEVVVCVPVCGGMGHLSTGVMGINYGVTFDITDGLTTRTIAGYLEVAQTRLPAGLTPPDCADRYRHLVNPAQVPGFERRTTWGISHDKSRVDFSIIDRQIPSKNPYPPGVVRANGSHRVAWRRSSRGNLWLQNSLSVELEMAHGAPSTHAWTIFGSIAASRIKFAGTRNRLILESLTADEDVFGNSYSFSAEWRALLDINQAINASAGSPPPSGIAVGTFDLTHNAIWQPLGTDWKLWQTSLVSVFDNRGLAGLQQLAGNDAIVDLCAGEKTIPWNAAKSPTPRPFYALPPIAKNERPPLQYSWIQYSQRIVSDVTRPTVRQPVLQAADPQVAPIGPHASGPASVGYSGSSTPDVVQEGGTSRHRVILIGSAVRAGHQIPRPALGTLNGQPCEELSALFSPGVVGNWFGVPIFRAAWVIEYMTPAPITSLSPRQNLEN